MCQGENPSGLGENPSGSGGKPFGLGEKPSGVGDNPSFDGVKLCVRSERPSAALATACTHEKSLNISRFLIITRYDTKIL